MAEVSTANLVKFIACNQQQFNGITPDENTLYFISDAGVIYKGSKRYSGGVYKEVSEFPALSDAVINTLYVNSTSGEVKFYNGAQMVTMVLPKTTELSADSTHAELATGKAVVDYVNSKVTADIAKLEEQVTTNTGDISELKTKMATVQGDATTEGSIAKAEADAKLYADDIKTDLTAEINKKADKATTLAGYGIADAYTKEQTDSAIKTAVATADHLKRAIVGELPDAAEADANTIYMVPSGSTKEKEAYTEYMVINGAWEKIGDSTVDLSNYYTKTQTDDKITDGVNTAETYADTKASEAQSAAETTAAADATKKANDALTAAKSYTDTQDAATLKSAKDYADGLAGNYATKAQGALAETALQKADIASGTANGTISVKGTDVEVKGLASAAYKSADAFDAAGAATTAETNAKAYADKLAGNYATKEQGSKADAAYSALTWGTL